MVPGIVKSVQQYAFFGFIFSFIIFIYYTNVKLVWVDRHESKKNQLKILKKYKSGFFYYYILTFLQYNFLPYGVVFF